MIERYAGFIALAVVLYWLFKDSAGTNGIFHSLGGAHTATYTAARGGV